MARIAASCTCSGAGKSGWPMQKLMMSLPCRASAFTSARTTKAFSVPRLAARRLTAGAEVGVDGGMAMTRIFENSRLYRSKIAADPAPPMLINCVVYQDGRKLADIDKHQISDYVSRPDCFVWVALKEPTEAELEEMREEFRLHE